MACILDHFGKDDIVMKPFPHVIVENLLPRRKYEALAGNFPKFLKGHLKMSNKRINLNTPSMFAKNVNNAWKQFANDNIGPLFWKKFVHIFRDAILSVYPGIEDQFQKKLEDFTTKMFEDKHVRTYDIGCASHAAINTSVRMKPSCNRGPHVDNPSELYSSLLYMREDGDESGGDLVIYETGEKINYITNEYGGSELDPEVCTEVSRAKYESNTLAMFINGPRSVHGVSVRDVTPYRRRFAVSYCRCSKGLFTLT